MTLSDMALDDEVKSGQCTNKILAGNVPVNLAGNMPANLAGNVPPNLAGDSVLPKMHALPKS